MSVSKDEAIDLVAIWIGARLNILVQQDMRPYVGEGYSDTAIRHNQKVRRETERELVALGLGVLPGEDKL